jgi:hypothetical protein
MVGIKVSWVVRRRVFGVWTRFLWPLCGHITLSQLPHCLADKGRGVMYLWHARCRVFGCEGHRMARLIVLI